MGRIVLPIRLREELNLMVGETYTFHEIVDEQTGEIYLAVKSCRDIADLVDMNILPASVLNDIGTKEN